MGRQQVIIYKGQVILEMKRILIFNFSNILSISLDS